VRGKTATLRLVFSLLDELDHVATDGRQRRGFDRKLEDMEAADEAWVAHRNEQETEIPAEPVSQGDIEEEPRPMWGEFAGEALGSTIEIPPPICHGPQQRAAQMKLMRGAKARRRLFSMANNSTLAAG